LASLHIAYSPGPWLCPPDVHNVHAIFFWQRVSPACIGQAIRELTRHDFHEID
jgi:hypothetical protein